MPTSKVFLFARARADDRLADFAQWFARDYPAALRAAKAPLQRFVLNICDVVPTFRIAPFIARGGAARPAYDVCAELWFAGDAGSDWHTTCLDGLGARAEHVHGDRVDEKGLSAPAAGTPVDIKFMALGRWQDHLTDAEGRRYWTEHARLVPRIHVGVNQYVQNWVTAGTTPDCPTVTGIAELHFPSVRSLGEDFYVSAEGQEEIRRDVSRFTKSATTLCVRDQVIVASPS